MPFTHPEGVEDKSAARPRPMELKFLRYSERDGTPCMVLVARGLATPLRNSRMSSSLVAEAAARSCLPADPIEAEVEGRLHGMRMEYIDGSGEEMDAQWTPHLVHAEEPIAVGLRSMKLGSCESFNTGTLQKGW